MLANVQDDRDCVSRLERSRSCEEEEDVLSGSSSDEEKKLSNKTLSSAWVVRNTALDGLSGMLARLTVRAARAVLGASFANARASRLHEHR